MSDSDKLAAILKMADPSSNSSYQERKVALSKAHEIMNKTGMSYASVGMSQKDAERIETQFSVTTNTQPEKPQKEKRLSIFSRSDEIAVSTPRHRQQPTSSRQKSKVTVTDWEAENERRDRAESDAKYDNWKMWKHAENIKQAENEESAKRLIKNFLVGIAFVAATGAVIVFSQNAALISAVTLITKIFGVIFMTLMAIFVIAISR